ncbi:hypothetical protein INR76_05870 [Marixanthomonas sp. SCSIO 43207]|uniref:hypothetical protein n=1 Tax=Marixanthomonas sp. SCSIO 43207 TaxID=2779360 RepID=UPI001CA9B70E|nr:hypothetical protein [Marixanthomonas sp. SCSIO 43207]UAB82286.1 hypothetical protein INR76_05870 [Marixanthomonas sp. SCSIO 43207]
MTRLIFALFLISFSSIAFAQRGKATLILKDNTRIDGFGEISGISSIVSVKFKNDTLKWRSYKSKEIIGIDILENDYYRQFRYKYKNKNKFPEILEIVSIDSLSLYVRTYNGSVLTNSFVNEPINGVDNPQKIELDNGQKINISQRPRNSYTEMNFPRYSYYVGFGESDQVEHLYTKGLPFAKSFKKSMKKYFKNCPSLIEKVENKEFKNDELWKVLDYYNRNCLNVKSE